MEPLPSDVLDLVRLRVDVLFDVPGLDADGGVVRDHQRLRIHFGIRVVGMSACLMAARSMTAGLNGAAAAPASVMKSSDGRVAQQAGGECGGNGMPRVVVLKRMAFSVRR